MKNKTLKQMFEKTLKEQEELLKYYEKGIEMMPIDEYANTDEVLLYYLEKIVKIKNIISLVKEKMDHL